MNDRSLSLQEKFLACQMKIGSLEKHICHSELGSFPILKDFLDDISSDINKCDFFVV